MEKDNNGIKIFPQPAIEKPRVNIRYKPVSVLGMTIKTTYLILDYQFLYLSFLYHSGY